MEMDFLGVLSLPPAAAPTADDHGGSEPRRPCERESSPQQVLDPDVQAPATDQLKPPTTTEQLTIFYAGNASVFDRIPREKVEQIMFMATKPPRAAGSPGVRHPPPSLQLQSQALESPRKRQKTLCDLPRCYQLDADVSLRARTASLVSFLERRKRRMAAAAKPPGEKDTSLTDSSSRNKTTFDDTEQPRVVRISENVDEQALNTDLKI